MTDPLEPVLEDLRQAPEIKAVQSQPQCLTSSLLNTVASVFELYGPRTTEAFLRAKRESADLSASRAIDALLVVVERLSRSEAVRRTPALGRLVIKTLRAVVSAGTRSPAHHVQKGASPR